MESSERYTGEAPSFLPADTSVPVLEITVGDALRRAAAARKTSTVWWWHDHSFEIHGL